MFPIGSKIFVDKYTSGLRDHCHRGTRENVGEVDFFQFSSLLVELRLLLVANEFHYDAFGIIFARVQFVRYIHVFWRNRHLELFAEFNYHILGGGVNLLWNSMNLQTVFTRILFQVILLAVKFINFI